MSLIDQITTKNRHPSSILTVHLIEGEEIGSEIFWFPPEQQTRPKNTILDL